VSFFDESSNERVRCHHEFLLARHNLLARGTSASILNASKLVSVRGDVHLFGRSLAVTIWLLVHLGFLRALQDWVHSLFLGYRCLVDVLTRGGASITLRAPSHELLIAV